MSLSQFFVLSDLGDILISREFRGDVVRGTPEIFYRRVTAMGEDAEPIFNMDGITFAYVFKYNLYFVCTTQFNLSPVYIIQLLHRCIRVFKDYCGIVSEESLRSNFVLIYEILDEILDYGYPQDTSTEHLKSYICNEAALTAKWDDKESKVKVLGSKGAAERKTKASSSTLKPVGGASRNEIYVDLLERISMLFNSSGELVFSEINGAIQMKSYLTGEPHLRLGINQDVIVGGRAEDAEFGAVVMDEVTFHPAVSMDEFESHRVVSLAPPDGEFVAMSYRISGGDFRAPFRVFPFMEDDDDASRFVFTVKIRGDFPFDKHANHVYVTVPLPACVTGVVCQLPPDVGSNQTARYVQESNVVDWQLTKFLGGTEASLTLVVDIEPTSPSWRLELGPVALDFELPMFNCSGVVIKFLKLYEREGYTPYRWVRYITHSDSYLCRV